MHSRAQLCDPMDCSPPGSSLHGIFQASILEKATISSSRESSQPRNQTYVSYVSCIARWFFTTVPPGNPVHHEGGDIDLMTANTVKLRPEYSYEVSMEVHGFHTIRFMPYRFILMMLPAQLD